MSRSTYLCGLLSTLVVIVGPAAAQASQVITDGPDKTGETSDQITDIVVTAQKREERLQDVPIAIAAITADTASKMGITETEDIGSTVPGLLFKKAGAYVNPVIRGIGSVPITQGDDSSVAIYVDGVLQVVPGAGIFSLNNIERIEVLKGPQGTLFGRNASAGVISIVTKTPSHDPYFDAAIGFANYDTFEATAYATTGLGDLAAIDIALHWRNQGEGWGRNLLLGTDIHKNHEFNARSKLRFEFGDTTDLTFSATYRESVDERVGSFRLAPGETGILGDLPPGFFNVNTPVPGGSPDLKHFDVSAQLRHDLSWGTFVSISAYSWQKFFLQYDLDGSPTPIADVRDSGFKDTSFTQEFQLLSPAGSSINWILGAFYLNSNSRQDPSGKIVGLSAFPADFLEFFAGQKTRSYAGFGQATFELLPKLNLTLGGRYTSDKRIRRTLLTTNFGPIAPEVRGSTTFDKFTYRIGVDYKIAEDVMAYLTRSTGFKSGVYNIIDLADDPVGPEDVTAHELGIKSHIFDKRVQFNAAIFHYLYENLQTSTIDSTTGTSKFVNAGKAKVKGAEFDVRIVPTSGLSLQGGVSYVDAKFTSFPDAILYVPLSTGGYTSGTTFDATGNRLTRAPEWSYNIGGQYTLETSSGEWTVAANYSYTGKLFWDFQNDHVEPSAKMLNASLTWASTDNVLELSVWGKNLLDDRIQTYVVPGSAGYIGLPSAPLTYGFTARVKI